MPLPISNTSLYGEPWRATAEPHFLGAWRPHAPGDPSSSRAAGRPFRERAGRTFRDQATRGDEALGRSLRCRIDQPLENRADRDDRNLDRSDQEGDGLAAPLRTLLVQEPGSPRHLRGIEGGRGAKEREVSSVTMPGNESAFRASNWPSPEREPHGQRA